MLTDAQCRNAVKRSKPYKLADEKGLYLFVTATGFRSWRWKYRFAGKERRLVFGPYPEVKLTEARDLRDAGRRLLRQGVDPAAKIKADRAAAIAAGETVKTVATHWHEQQAPRWKPKHAKAVLDSLAADVFGATSAELWEGKFGDLPIAAVTPRQVRALLQAVQARGATEAAHRIRGRMSAFFGLAIAEELVESDPAAAVAVVLKPVRKGRMPALTGLEEARAFLRAAEAAPSHPVTKLASRLLALTAVRPGVIRWTPRDAEFAGLEGEQPLWTVPAERMKLELRLSDRQAFDLVVPLSSQAIDVIRAAQRHAGRAPWLFPGIRHAHRPISENALSFAYKRLTEFRGRHVPHGWRSTFSSVMNELAATQGRLGDEDVIELMLGHKPKGVRGIYNRAAYLQRRREIAQEWADLLLEGFAPASTLLDGPRR